MSLTAKFGVVVAFWLAVGLIQTFNWGSGIEKAIVMLLLIMAAPFVVAAARATSTSLPPRWERAAGIATIVLLVAESGYLIGRILHPHLIDVATTTLAAGDAILHGMNPYAVPIDTGPESAGFTGYKYLPVMALAYLPLGALLGQRGILLTNLVLLLTSVWLLKHLARSNLAPLLFLMLPLMPQQIFAKGATDMAPVVPLLAAFLFVERNGFLTGLCVGLSIAAKPLPGAMFLPCLLPSVERERYALGIAAGLTPILPFLVASPQSLFANIVTFTLTRSADGTSWLYHAPPEASAAARLVLGASFLYAAIFVWRQVPNLATRAALGTMLTIAAILAGPGAHHNYQLWWLPFAALMLSLALAPDEACQEEPLRYTTAAGMDARGS